MYLNGKREKEEIKEFTIPSLEESKIEEDKESIEWLTKVLQSQVDKLKTDLLEYLLELFPDLHSIISEIVLV